ncbi:MAG: hypothetical protein JSW27_01385 [Phycisphaerales bacterium]|nr:MAG: hypothetical protein JSW27_01385 [Phycisphaerales bacterium]
MNKVELAELISDLMLSLQTDHGYEEASRPTAYAAPALPKGASGDHLVARESEGGLEFIRIGCWQYRSRPPRIGLYGAASDREGNLTENPDLAIARELLMRSLALIQADRTRLMPGDLEHKIIQLSYIDVAGAFNALQGLGINTIDKEGTIPDPIEFGQLPLVLEMSSPGAESMGLVGKGEVGRGQFGSTVVPTLASELHPDLTTSPSTRLMVLFHPAHPEQYSRVQRVIEEVVDRPARQIYVEGLVLEISSAAMQQLGIEWELQDGQVSVAGGSDNASLSSFTEMGKTFLFTGTDAQDLASQWMAKIRALLIDGRAEILSRPSVLALDNRQATIRIGRDIPIATSQEGLQADSSKISFDFKYLALGILLNIRPRVSQDGREISLMVDTVVSSEVPESDLEIRDEDGRLLASAPRVVTRRVQTYARIQNNTPFVIGGLVSRNDTRVTEKVPFLGDLPGLGLLFRSESTSEIRSEVIIVLTPYVLPETLHLSRALPAQTEFLDDKDSELFRHSYRIETGDIVDVSFLYRNQRFQRHRDAAINAIAQDYRYAEREPFYSFSEGRLPGEKVIVDRIIYNALRRLELGSELVSERIFVLTDLDAGSYQSKSLDTLVSEMLDFASQSSNKALAISFHDPYESPDGQSLVSDPVPEIRVVECLDRRAWSRLLRELNQPAEGGRRCYSILIHSPEDVERLARAVMVKYVLEINGGRGPEASLLKFIPGRIIEVPDIDPERDHLIDASVARYFYHSSEHFYIEALEKIEAALESLDQEFKRPELRQPVK